MQKPQPLRLLALSGVLCAIVILFTLLVSIPIPGVTGAYVNAGDAAVLLCGYVLGGPLGFLCAGLGSLLADILHGSMIYALPSFLIKGAMALVGAMLYKKAQGKKSLWLLTATVAGLIMPIGYFAFEALFFSPALAALSIPGNALQYLTGVILSLPLVRLAQSLLDRIG